MKTLVKSLFKHLFFWQRSNRVYVFIHEGQRMAYPDFLERSSFYLQHDYSVVPYKNVFHFFLCLFNYGPHRVIFTTSGIPKSIVSLYFLNVDYKANPSDGWAWHEAINRVSPVTEHEIQQSKDRFNDYCNSLPIFETSLVLGTGPSLAKVRNLLDLDCYKIACNTIVKDLDLWMKLKLHFLVAGDAIYHFGHNQYATSFRRDLKKCLSLYPVAFVYPALYHPFIKREFSEFEACLYPVPTGASDQLNNNLRINFTLPALGNVLNLLLLPIATTLAKNIYLLGFDGRAPDDKLFWSNSNDHSYTEYISDIQKKHPVFFDYFIDNKNPFKYVNTVHGDALDNNMTLLESKGYTFTVISPSHTATMQKRYKAIFAI